MKTKEIAENKLQFNVIYGDTDSIMINTGTSLINQALQMGKKLKSEINCLYKCLEIEIDGLFKSMLLLKKKKYAALKVENFMSPNENERKTICEMKGLDMVRRDWCALSKDISKHVLDQILSGKPREEVVLDLNDYLSAIGKDMKEGRIKLSDYIIIKQLTRAVADYQDIKALPHVAVAKRLAEKGKLDNDNTFINYVIC